MTAAYTPGLNVSRRKRHRVRRMLPVSGEVLVGRGDQVEAHQIVARTNLPGDITVVNLANLLAVPPGDVPAAMRTAIGDPVEPGVLMARSKGIFGMFRSTYHARHRGTVETVSAVTGQMIIRGAPKEVEVPAYLSGEVVEVIPHEGVEIEAEVAYLQGIFGIGPEAFGKLVMACASPNEELSEDLITGAMADQVIIGGARMTGAAVRRAIEVGAAGIVSGGFDDADLRQILGYDLGVAVTGNEQIGTTVIITEGFGEIAMAQRTFELLASHAGDFAAINGTTQIRAGVMRPEVVIPLGAPVDDEASESTAAASGFLAEGTSVRIIRDPHFGLLGRVRALPSEPRVLASGSKARVLEVSLDAGQTVIVPRANVELIDR